MTTLYKVDSKGKIRVINYWVSNDSLVQESGILGGSLVPNSKVCKGKNIGKSNETTPNQQAHLELDSKVQEKLSEGYFYTISEAESSTVILPMLAKSYDDEKDKVNWNGHVVVQPKLDGMRCLAFIKEGKVTLQSRDGKTITTMQHIEKELAMIDKDIILDGELYVHGLSFQENMKLIKKYRPGETEQVKFVVYDCVSEESYVRRMHYYSMWVATEGPKHLQLIPCKRIFEEKELNEYHKHCLSEGFEGTILRWSHEGYQIDTRSKYLLKKKDFFDTVAIVIDVLPSDARPEQGVLLVKLDNGLQCKASLKMSHAERANILTNKKDYIGQTAELRYFEMTDDGLLRFPICVGFRLDK